MVGFAPFIFWEDRFCMDDVSSAFNSSEAYLHSAFAFKIISVEIISYILNISPCPFDSRQWNINSTNWRSEGAEDDPLSAEKCNFPHFNPQEWMISRVKSDISSL
jgi:hypothetical protein